MPASVLEVIETFSAQLYPIAQDRSAQGLYLIILTAYFSVSVKCITDNMVGIIFTTYPLLLPQFHVRVNEK